MNLRRFVRDTLRPAIGFVLAGLGLTAFLIGAAAFLVFSCTPAHAQVEIRMASRQGVDGNMVPVLQVRGLECPNALSKGAAWEGCSYFGYVNFIGGGANIELTARHEDDHVAGMRHSPDWLTAGSGHKCVVILAQGHTQWKAGNLLCRRGDGSYYQIQP